MSGTLAYVENLTDAELYKELRKHGFPAGPVVASTRKLYQHKLFQILEGTHGRGDQQEPSQQADEMEEQLTQPVRTDGGSSYTKWSHESQSDNVRSRTGLSQTYPSHSGDVAAGRSSMFQSSTYYTPSREQGKDEMRTHSSVSSSYLGTVRGVGNYEDNSKASPSWLSNSSATQPRTSPSWRTYGSFGDESFGKSRYRTTLSDTSPAARQEMVSRYRLTAFLDEKASAWNRRNPERQRYKSVSLKAWLVAFTVLVVVAVALYYMVYNAWHENDPYQQIEQDVVKIIEERELLDKQE